jgi:hypothetical protein
MSKDLCDIMTTKSKARESQEDIKAGTRQTIVGGLAAIALFLIILITGKPIIYIGGLGASLVYGIGICLPAICVASVAIHKSRNAI